MCSLQKTSLTQTVFPYTVFMFNESINSAIAFLIIILFYNFIIRFSEDFLHEEICFLMYMWKHIQYNTKYFAKITRDRKSGRYEQCFKFNTKSNNNITIKSIKRKIVISKNNKREYRIRDKKCYNYSKFYFLITIKL